MKRRKIIRYLVYLVGCAAGLLALLLIFPTPAAVLLAIGWYSFATRTFPSVTFSWSGLTFAGICTALALLIAHTLVRAFARRMPNCPSAWPFSRTLALFAAFCWTFIVIMTASGLFQSVKWLFATDEPLYVERPNGTGRTDLILAVHELQDLLDDQANAATVRARLSTHRIRNQSAQGTLFSEHYRFLVSHEHDGRVKDVFVVPRNPAALQRSGAVIIGRNWDLTFVSSAELDAKIAAIDTSPMENQ